MKTTINIDDTLLAWAHETAAAEGKSLSRFIEDALLEYIAGLSTSEPQPHLKLRSFRGDGVLPGVDINDNAALLDLMERDDPKYNYRST